MPQSILIPAGIVLLLSACSGKITDEGVRFETERDTAETRLESNEVIGHLHLPSCVRRQVQHDLAITSVTGGNACVLVHQSREVRGESLIDTPLPDGA